MVLAVELPHKFVEHKAYHFSRAASVISHNNWIS